MTGDGGQRARLRCDRESAKGDLEKGKVSIESEEVEEGVKRSWKKVIVTLLTVTLFAYGVTVALKSMEAW